MTKPNAKHWFLTISPGGAGPEFHLAERLRLLGAASVGRSAYLVPKDPLRSSELIRLLSEINRRGGRASLSSTVFSTTLSGEPGGLPPAKPLFPEGSLPLSNELTVAESPEAAFRTIRSLMADARSGSGSARSAVQKVEGKIWVTGKGVRAETSACAWLIWRFIDPAVVFKFVTPGGYLTTAGELSYGMPGADFQSDAARNTFEVLAETFNLQGAAFEAMAQFLHATLPGGSETIEPPAETKRLKALLFGVIMTHKQDLHRFQRSFPILDRLYTTFQSGPEITQ